MDAEATGDSEETPQVNSKHSSTSELNLDDEDASQHSEVNTELESVLNDLNARQKEQLDEYLERINKLEENQSRLIKNCMTLEQKLEAAVKQKDAATKEKESMVMRYAVSEKSLLKQQSAKEQLEKKAKDVAKENELLQHKLASMSADKSRICQLLDNKGYELKCVQQDVERMKTDFAALETKLKWSQNNLKNEMELRKESDAKVENLNSRIHECIDMAEKAKRDSSDSIREFHTSQENRAHILDQQLKELQATLILLRHERDDRDQQAKSLQSELERVQKKQNETLHENNGLSMKVQQLERERSELEQRLSELRDCADQQRQDAADLHSKTTQLEQLKLQLKNEHGHSSAMNEQISALKQRNSDLLSDMESTRIHEAELLSFTHQLTDKNVRLQSEFTAMETKVQQMGCELTLARRNLKETETKAALAAAQTLELKNRLTEEKEQLVVELNEKTRMCDRLTHEIADQKGEYCVMKRKLELSLKELNKELSQCRKKLEQCENNGTASSSSSSSSLNAVERCRNSPTIAPEQVKVVQPERELDRQTLIEHIVKLQRLSARKSEKLDFLEEHVNTLVAELQKKSRLLQSYILREQSGTMSSNSMDNNKANLAKYSGIMASMYSSKIVDDNLTLELSLDINRKLQAVLEDALLKNITLKENVDTLGAEIDRLLKTNSS